MSSRITEKGAVTLPLRLAVFFAVNPERTVSTFEIAELFDVNPQQLTHRLRHMIEAALLVKLPRLGGRGNPCVYGAGPALLQMIGKLPPPPKVDRDEPLVRRKRPMLPRTANSVFQLGSLT